MRSKVTFGEIRNVGDLRDLVELLTSYSPDTQVNLTPTTITIEFEGDVTNTRRQRESGGPPLSGGPTTVGVAGDPGPLESTRWGTPTPGAAPSQDPAVIYSRT